MDTHRRLEDSAYIHSKAAQGAGMPPPPPPPERTTILAETLSDGASLTRCQQPLTLVRLVVWCTVQSSPQHVVNAHIVQGSGHPRGSNGRLYMYRGFQAACLGKRRVTRWWKISTSNALSYVPYEALSTTGGTIIYAVVVRDGTWCGFDKLA